MPPAYATQELQSRETEAAAVVKDFFERRYNGHSQALMAALPLTDLVEASDFGDELYCRDADEAATIYKFPSNITFLALRETSRTPPHYRVTVFNYEDDTLASIAQYDFEGGEKLTILAQASKRAETLGDQIIAEEASTN